MASPGLSYTFLSFLFLILGGIVFLVLSYYGNIKTQPKYVHIACFTAFFFAASIILVLPLDLASTRYRLCVDDPLIADCNEPTINVSRDFLYAFWKLTYWTTFILSMFIVPVMQGYVRSGAFNFRGRLWDGIKDNLQFYGIAGGAGFILLIYAIVGLKIPASLLINLAIPAANAYGLVYLILYLSYGLVQLPRGIWYHANVKWLLRYSEVQAPELKEAVVDSESDAYEIAREVAHAARVIPSDNPLRPLVDVMTERCPIALQPRGVPDNDDGLPETYTRPILKALNRRIGRVNFLHQRDQALLKNLMKRAFLYQDIIESYTNPNKRFNSQFLPFPIPEGPYKDNIEQALWWWYVWVNPISMRSLSLLCAAASLIILWSESTFQISSVRLSIPAMLLSPGAIDHLALEWLATLFICYVCACTYSTILSLKIFDIYRVVPEHHTDEATLLFVALNLCRLTFPLCYNFLNMAGLADGKKGSNGSIDYGSSPVFIQYLGPAVNLTPLLGSSYNDWMPYCILVMSVVFLLNLHTRLLRLFKMKNFAYEDIKAGTDTEEGRQIIAQARTIEERRLQRGGAAGTGPSSSASHASQPQARNTQELLAKYKAKKANEGSLEGLNAGFPSTSSNAVANKTPSNATGGNGGFFKSFGDYLPKGKSTSRQGFQRLTGEDDLEANHTGDLLNSSNASSSSNRKFGLASVSSSTPQAKSAASSNLFQNPFSTNDSTSDPTSSSQRQQLFSNSKIAGSQTQNVKMTSNASKPKGGRSIFDD